MLRHIPLFCLTICFCPINTVDHDTQKRYLTHITAVSSRGRFAFTCKRTAPRPTFRRRWTDCTTQRVAPAVAVGAPRSSTPRTRQVGPPQFGADHTPEGPWIEVPAQRLSPSTPVTAPLTWHPCRAGAAGTHRVAEQPAACPQWISAEACSG